MTSLSLAGFELAVPEIKRLQGCVIDRMATGLRQGKFALYFS